MVSAGIERRSQISHAVQAGLRAIEGARDRLYSSWEEGGIDTLGRIKERIMRKGRVYRISSPNDPIERSVVVQVNRGGAVETFANAKTQEGARLQIPIGKSGPDEMRIVGNMFMAIDRAERVRDSDLR